ncbi:MAG: CRISPR-associated protein Cas5 [Candidatus Micrarchaeaceae archaeon]
MKTLVMRISFFEAFFKVHYTKTSRITYPIPLPTSVAGMFGGMLGLSRKEASKYFADCVFGACVDPAKKISENRENATYILFSKLKQPNRGKGVETISIINEPTYLIAIGGDEEKIAEIREQLMKGISYLPFGGQNDFFVKDWSFVGNFEIMADEYVSNYVPTMWVGEISKDTTFQILPVNHNLPDIDRNFTFILNGSVKLKKEWVNKINTVEVEGKHIALYPLHKFVVVGEWGIQE